MSREIRVTNMVFKAGICADVDIPSSLSTHGTVEEMRNGGVKFSKDGGTCSFLLKWKDPRRCFVICTGADNEEVAGHEIRELAGHLGRLLYGPELINMQAVGRVSYDEIDLDFLHTFLQDSGFLPGGFPGLRWSTREGTCTIHTTGRVVILGVKSLERARELLDELEDVMADLPFSSP